MKFKLDENLGGSIAVHLRDAGHDAHSVRDEGLSGRPDAEIARACAGEERCLVTLDLDFANPLEFRPSDYHGIVVIRLPPNPGIEDLRLDPDVLLRAMSTSDVRQRLWVIKGSRLREYSDREHR